MNEPIRPLSEPAIQRAVDTFCGSTAGLCDAIDPRDEMLRYNRDLLYGNATCAATLYFVQGAQIAATVGDIAAQAFGGWRYVGAFLDFASGYGRATRFVARDVPPRRMWISDIVPEAVAFQASHFGVHGLVSTADPGDLAIDRTFDYIFVASLFSHLPAATFGPWLDRLLGLLAPDGLLAFSVLDGQLLGDPSIGDPRDGIVFQAESESTVLPGDQYGTAYVTEAFVRSQVRVVNERAEVARIAAGLCGHQDLYLVAPQPSDERPSVHELRPRLFAKGELDHLEQMSAKRVEIAGWAKAPGGVDSVRVWTAKQPRRATVTVSDSSDPSDTVRWRATLDLDAIGLDELVLLVARDGTGVETPFAVGTLRPFLGSS